MEKDEEYRNYGIELHNACHTWNVDNVRNVYKKYSYLNVKIKMMSYETKNIIMFIMENINRVDGYKK